MIPKLILNGVFALCTIDLRVKTMAVTHQVLGSFNVQSLLGLPGALLIITASNDLVWNVCLTLFNALPSVVS